VDILGGFSDIATMLSNSTFKNQYEFDRAVLELAYAAYDGYFLVVLGSNEIFVFKPPAEFQLVSVFSDQCHLPEVYVYGESAWLLSDPPFFH
jgi:hypothetical protein